MNDDFMNNKVILYGTKTCTAVSPVKGILRRANVNYDYIDIGSDPDGKEFVRSVNDGYESVPTLVFPDGSVLTEPSNRELEEKLQKIGYHTVPPKPWDILRENLFFTLLGVGGILFGIIDGNTTFVGLGIGLIVLTFIMSYTRR